jgi:hypothetical protein
MPIKSRAAEASPCADSSAFAAALLTLVAVAPPNDTAGWAPVSLGKDGGWSDREARDEEGHREPAREAR